MLKVSLIVVSGKPEGKQIPLIGPTFRIGRDESCNLKAASDQISRKHAEITIGEDSVVVADLGSRNGTFVNNVQLTGPMALKGGELLKVGYLTFAVSIQGAPAGAKAARPTPPVGPMATSSDVVEQDKIKTWLVADNTHATPDRASGVYDGDTLTLDAYSGGSLPAVKPPSASSQPVAKPPSASAQPAAKTPAPPAPKPLVEVDQEFERLEEGAGDADEEAGASDDEDGDEATPDDQFLDESNPFFVAKKAQSQAEEATKQSYKDTSDAATDILRKLMDRRRASRS